MRLIFSVALFLTLSIAQICNAQTRLDNYIKTGQPKSKQESITNVKPADLDTLGGWTPFFTQEMNEVWKSISLKGVNYYSLGEPLKKDGFSERSNYKSKLYQAWFGTYVIDAKDQLFDFPNADINSTKPEVIEKLLNIALLDQTSWLYAMADPKASTSTSLIQPSDDFKILDTLFIDGHHVPVIEFYMNSHSDLSGNDTGLPQLVGMPVSEMWKEHVDAYHLLVIHGFYAFWYNAADKTLKIVYGTGCRFVDKDNKRHDTYPLLKDDMLKMAKQLTYIKANELPK